MLNSLNLINFRSHNQLEINIDSQNIAIIGNNAVGKTNILESIYYSFLTKPFFSRQVSMIKKEEDFLKISLSYDDENLKKYELEYVIQTKLALKRTIKLNKINKKPSEIIGIIPIVVFLPDSVRIITDLPEYRRKFLNTILIQANTGYLATINTYQKTLKQRNQLLFDIKTKGASKEALFVYNLQLASLIEDIYTHRSELIKFINTQISDYYSKISGVTNKLFVEYLPTLPNNKDEIIKQLESNIDNDIKAGYSTRGPHKDDYIIKLNSENTRQGLSRGENRSLILALKMIELNYLNHKLNKLPILLLDDVLSELDGIRQQHLLEVPQARQTFITSTSLSDEINNYQVIKL